MNDAEAAESKQDLMSAGLNGIAQQKKPRLHRDLLIDFGRLILRRQRKIDEEIVKMMVYLHNQ
jgi:hypothetical protein